MIRRNSTTLRQKCDSLELEMWITGSCLNYLSFQLSLMGIKKVTILKMRITVLGFKINFF